MPGPDGRREGVLPIHRLAARWQLKRLNWDKRTRSRQDMGLNHRDTEHTEELVSVCSVPLW
jgi:hypothetical protein